MRTLTVSRTSNGSSSLIVSVTGDNGGAVLMAGGGCWEPGESGRNFPLIDAGNSECIGVTGSEFGTACMGLVLRVATLLADSDGVMRLPEVACVVALEAVVVAFDGPVTSNGSLTALEEALVVVVESEISRLARSFLNPAVAGFVKEAGGELA